MSFDVVADLKSRFLPDLEAFARQLRGEFETVRVDVWASSVGSLTEYQGFGVGIDCVLPEVPLHQPNNVALSIGVRHITTEPMLCEADVCWGHPSGTLETDLIPQEVPYTIKNASDILERLPMLVESLRRALIRGRPCDEVD